MTEGKQKLIVIDGNSLLYRAFFAMRYLSTSDGQPTNAIYGFTSMLLRVLDEKPDYIVVAFDTGKPTFRHEEYDQYKAHRPPTPDALISQAPIARELVRAFNIPVVQIEGYEADDIIGAMAKEAKEQGLYTIIVTGDLDALQLVDDDVNVMTTIKGVSDTVIYDRAAVIARFGIAPEQMADYKGLKGDPSDNIPGVPGIGDKTAANLLKQYGSIENLLDHIDDLPEGKAKRTLRENAELARLSKHLATIETDLPQHIDLASYKAQEPDYAALRDLFVRLEFKTMLKRLPEVGKAEGRAELKETALLGVCRQINSSEEFNALLKALRESGAFAMQVHTSHEKSIRAEIIGVSFSVGAGHTAYVRVIDPAQEPASLGLNFEGPFEADLSLLAPVLADESIAKFCHDSKRNFAAFKLRGVQLLGVTFDSMLGAYLLDSSRGSFSIGEIAFEQLSLELPGVTEKKADVRADDVTITCGEAEAIYRLQPVLEEKLRTDGMMELFEKIELPLAPILADMELAGVSLDVEQLEALSITLNVDLRNLEHEVYDIAGQEFNIGSPKQLQSVLFEKLGLTASKKTKTGYSTSASALEALALEHPIVELILRWRELSKIKSTYADALPKLINPKTNRVHTSLNQAVTATGRLSSSDPNLQNIPVRTELGREIRKAFIASGDNQLLSADYSQIELRILAHVTEDAELVSAFENDKDIHTATACTLFNCSPQEVTPEMRRRAKTINFAVIYGMSDFTLAHELSMSIHDARDYIDTYFNRFPGVRAYIDGTTEKARTQGYVETLMGRRRYIPDINSSNRNIRQFAERAAVNMPIQGTAADIMKLAMIRVADNLKESKLPAKMVLQVHDELLFEFPPEILGSLSKLVREGMENAFPMRVPLRVDMKTGPDWADMIVAPK